MVGIGSLESGENRVCRFHQQIESGPERSVNLEEPY